MSKQTQFIVLDVNHPQHPMHPVDPDNYIVLRQRYGDGKPTKSKPEDFASVDLIASEHTFHIKNSIPDMQYGTDLILCTDKNGGTYAFLGEWRNGMCYNPNTKCHDLRKDAPPRKEKVPVSTSTVFMYHRSAPPKPVVETVRNIHSYDVVCLVQSHFDGIYDLIMCYDINSIGVKDHCCLYLGRWNDGC